MLRFRPDPDYMLLGQTNNFYAEAGGSESNVAITLSRLGHETTMLTGLPDNSLGRMVIAYLRSHGVDTGRIALSESGRLGTYFTEKGTGHRPSRVIYDREGSVYNFLEDLVKDQDAWLSNCSWLHLSGIALATSRSAADFALNLTSAAHERDMGISLDINHRKLLWRWCKGEKERLDCLMEVAARATILAGNETDLEAGLFGAPSKDEEDLIPRLSKIATQGNLKWVAISLRESKQADLNKFSGLIYDFREDQKVPKKYMAGPRTVTSIIDRVGTGDAFCGAVLDGYLKDMEPQKCLERAVMLGTLMHGISGDACQIDDNFLEYCLKDDSGRIIR